MLSIHFHYTVYTRQSLLHKHIQNSARIGVISIGSSSKKHCGSQAPVLPIGKNLCRLQIYLLHCLTVELLHVGMRCVFLATLVNTDWTGDKPHHFFVPNTSVWRPYLVHAGVRWKCVEMWVCSTHVQNTDRMSIVTLEIPNLPTMPHSQVSILSQCTMGWDSMGYPIESCAQCLSIHKGKAKIPLNIQCQCLTTLVTNHISVFCTQYISLEWRPHLVHAGVSVGFGGSAALRHRCISSRNVRSSFSVIFIYVCSFLAIMSSTGTCLGAMVSSCRPKARTSCCASFSCRLLNFTTSQLLSRLLICHCCFICNKSSNFFCFCLLSHIFCCRSILHHHSTNHRSRLVWSPVSRGGQNEFVQRTYLRNCNTCLMPSKPMGTHARSLMKSSRSTEAPTKQEWWTNNAGPSIH